MNNTRAASQIERKLCLCVPVARRGRFHSAPLRLNQALASIKRLPLQPFAGELRQAPLRLRTVVGSSIPGFLLTQAGALPGISPTATRESAQVAWLES